MKTELWLRLLPLILALLCAGRTLAATHYVNLNNTAPTAPYTSWAAAATNIQDAVDAAAAGDDILVTNGVYQTGARAIYGMSNRVAVTLPVTVRSVNGAEVTLLVGYQVPGTTNGDSAVRCVYLSSGAVLAGFTLTNGATRSAGDGLTNVSGGGVWCESGSAVVSNCVLTGNSAYNGGGASSGTLNDCMLIGNSAQNVGGGADYATLNNCILTGNSAFYGGGAFAGTLRNCALTGNVAQNSGGGASGGTLNNCILFYNTARISGDNYDNSYSLSYCCTTPLPSGGAGNIDAEPQLASSSHLSVGSPCRGAGSAAYANGVDIDGEPWANTPSIGCDEYWSGSVTGALSVAPIASYTNVAVGFPVDLQALIGGRLSASRWDFGDGVVVSNRIYASHAWNAGGDYFVELRAYNESYPAGVAASVMVHVAASVYYVALSSPSPSPPYSSWATAATNIQDALDAATLPGALVLVSNGVYQTGMRAVYGMNNRIAVTKPMTVRSLNGPEVTTIVGDRWVPARCVYLTNGAVLAGFTLTNGGTQSTGDYSTQQSGGGVWCESASAVVSNSVLTGNSAYGYGGGAFSGTLNNCKLTGNSGGNGGGGASDSMLNNCTLTGNSAFDGGGAYRDYSSPSTLNNCALIGNSATYGGGAYSVTLRNCTLAGNSAQYGGGAYYATLSNCALSGNSAWNGGGVYGGTLNNCTLTGNSASYYGGGAYYGTFNNSILFYNKARVSGDNYYAVSLTYCCTTPLPSSGSGNIAAEPQLGSASHLSANSQCRGAGSAAYTSGMDIDGEPWADPPSIGCDEYSSGTVTGALTAAIIVSFTNVAAGFAVDFQANIAGRLSASRWDFGDGVVLSNRPYASHTWSAAGDYVVELRAYNESYSDGVAASVTVHVTALPVYYVSLSNPAPAPPYNSWTTAATNIQDALDAVTVPGALVLVSNGVYQTGGRLIYGMSNRVAVTQPISVRSINGPDVTSIVGSGSVLDFGNSQVRCAYLTNGAVLAGFTLSKGATQSSGDVNRQQSGGGVWCESPNAVVSNCVLTGNSATYYGAGAFYGTLNNCVLTGNSASAGGGASGDPSNPCILRNCILTSNSAGHFGGGAYSAALNNSILTGNSALEGGGVCFGTLHNCTLTGNSGGGASSATLNNCVAYYNTAGGSIANYDGGSMNYCCTTPLPSGGSGNIDAEPQLASSSHLSSISPCQAAGSAAYASGLDIDGELWANPPSIGCDEYWSGSVTGALTAAIIVSLTNVATGSAIDLQAVIAGQVSASSWNFGDGVVVSNRPYVSHTWDTAGDYVVELRAYNESYAQGLAANVTVHVAALPVHYVVLNSSSPAPPYTSWATAATNIQDALDAVTLPGALVLVSNGVYQAGSRAVFTSAWMSNRVAVTKPVTVRSVNGPAVTTIAGSGTRGSASVRCVYLTNGAVLAGFTLTNGFAQNPVGGGAGGGVWCQTVGAIVSNCVVTGNSATNSGGGAAGGTLNNCILTGNSAGYVGGGAINSTLNNCTLTGNSARYDGGGAYSGSLNNCLLTSNSASHFGGGAYSAALNNCGLLGNSAQSGGGVYYGAVSNCSFTGNSASSDGGGAAADYKAPCILNNCKLTGNSATNRGGAACDCTLSNCVVTANMATYGGGIYRDAPPFPQEVHNCTLAGNRAAYGGGAWGAYGVSLYNCILYYNTASASGDNYYTGGSVFYSCTTPVPPYNAGNFTNAPLFVDTNGWSNLRLQSNSPCINAGNNDYAARSTDLDGNPRVVGGTVDVGAYEFQSPQSLISYVWLQSYGQPADGSADFIDLDGDGMNNWQEWRAGTDPTNSLSVLRMLTPAASAPGVKASWQSVSGVYYILERGTNCSMPASFVPLALSFGNGGTNSYWDTNAVGAGPFFYRVRLR